jgi:hypothetical protein
MKRTSAWIVAPVAVVAAVQPAAAADPFVHPYSLRAGPGISSDGSAQIGFHAGVSRNLGPGRVDIDFARYTHSGTRAQTAGLSYVHRIEFGSAGKFYAGLGVGGYHVSVKAPGSGAAIDKDKFSLGGKILVGVNLTDRVFVEAGFTKVQKVAGVDASNGSVVLGIRF